MIPSLQNLFLLPVGLLKCMFLTFNCVIKQAMVLMSLE